MKFSKRIQYALRALVHLANVGGVGFAQSRDIAKRERLPVKFIESILLSLKQHGVLESKVGLGGGYRLTRPASQVVIGDVVRKLEESPTLSDIASKSDAAAGESALDLIRERLARVHAEVLNSLTLEELVDEVQKNAKARDAMYFI